MSFTLAQIINLGDTARTGLLDRFDSGGAARMTSLIRGDGDLLDLRAVRPSLSPSVRPFDDVDLAAAIAVNGVRVAIGKPDQDVWFYCEAFTPVALTPVAVSTSIEGDASNNEVQLITLGAGAYGGSYSVTLTLKNFGTGDGTSNVARSFTLSGAANAEEIAAILLTHPEAVKTGKNGLRVTGEVGGPFTVEFCEHQGKYNVAAITAANVNLLLPKRITGTLTQQAALATAFAAAGTPTLTGTYEIEIQFPGESPQTVLQIPVVISKDVITTSVTPSTDAGSFRFLAGLTGYTGGSATDLDGVVTVGKVFHVVVFVHATNGLQFYQLVAGTDAEASPGIIRPDDYNGATNARVWKSV